VELVGPIGTHLDSFETICTHVELFGQILIYLMILADILIIWSYFDGGPKTSNTKVLTGFERQRVRAGPKGFQNMSFERV
jgi:hypothetical protein